MRKGKGEEANASVCGSMCVLCCTAALGGAVVVVVVRVVDRCPLCDLMRSTAVGHGAAQNLCLWHQPL